MIIRIALSPAVPAEQEALRRENLQKRFKPALVKQPGFVAGFWGDAGEGGTVSVTVWESEELLREGARVANSLPLLPGFAPEDLPGPDQGQVIHVFEVTEHELPAAGGA